MGTRVLDVVYNATNNELVRTKTIVKNCIVTVDANPFRQWYLRHNDVELNKKKVEESDKARAETKRYRHLEAKLKHNAAGRIIDPKVAEQFHSGRLLACVSSRPGQSGRCDGYILEGSELEFYQKKLEKRRSEQPPPPNSRNRICPLLPPPRSLMKQLCVRVVSTEMIVRTFLNCFY